MWNQTSLPMGKFNYLSCQKLSLQLKFRIPYHIVSHRITRVFFKVNYHWLDIIILFTLKVYIMNYFESIFFYYDQFGLYFFYFKSIWFNFNGRINEILKMSRHTIHINCQVIKIKMSHVNFANVIVDIDCVT